MSQLSLTTYSENKLLSASEFAAFATTFISLRERHVLGYLTTYHGSILYGGIKTGTMWKGMLA